MAIYFLGFTISKQGVKLPFSKIQIPLAPLFLLITHLTASAKADTFPKDGTFGQQENFIRRLPKQCPTSTSNVIRDLVQAENPFAHMSTIPKDFTVELYRHEFDENFGVVTCRKAATEGSSVTDKKITENEKVYIGGEGNGFQPLTFVFERTPDGNLKPIAKERISVDTYAAGLEFATKNAGIVAGVKSSDAHCYHSNSRRFGAGT